MTVTASAGQSICFEDIFVTMFSWAFVVDLLQGSQYVRVYLRVSKGSSKQAFPCWAEAASYVHICTYIRITFLSWTGSYVYH